MNGAPGASANDPREDAMAYAIIESLDVDKFREILSGSYGAKARLPGSGPGMMYSLMETHFGERAEYHLQLHVAQRHTVKQK